MKRVKLPAVIATLLAVLATGPALAVESVFIQSRLDYNAILITGVDIIFVYDQQSLQAMPETKTDWYSGKRAFIEQAGDSADVVSILSPRVSTPPWPAFPSGAMRH